jgi:hypothetical protein
MRFKTAKELGHVLIDQDLYDKHGARYFFSTGGRFCKQKFKTTEIGIDLNSILDVEFTESTPSFKDKQIIWAWDVDYQIRRLRFWDALNNCTFSTNGSRRGANFNHYAALSKENIEPWMTAIQDSLED